MFKNTAGQKVTFLAIDTTTNLPKTGDAANLTAYVSIDDGSVTSLGGSPQTAATEKDATNAPGLYDFALAQAESNGDKLVFAGRSNTSGVRLVPITIYTRPPNFGAMSINSSGQLDMIKLAGTTQTARDIGASVLLSTGTGTGQLDFTSGVVKANLAQILGTALTETAGQIAAGFKKFFNIATPAATMDHLILVDTVTTVTNQLTAGAIATGVWQDAVAGDFTAANTIGKSIMNGVALGTGLTINSYTGNTPQTGDAYARIGANGVSLSAIPDLAGVTTLLSRLSSARAGYLDNINNAGLATTVAQTGDNYPISARMDGLLEDGSGSPTYKRFKSAALEQGPTGGGASAATIAAAVWDEARSGHVTSGSFGQGVASVQGNVTGSVASVTGFTPADIATILGIILKLDYTMELAPGSPTYYRFTTGALELSPTGGSAPSAATIADAVWDELRSGHVASGSFGQGVVVNSIATDAIDANALKTDAVTEIQSGLSTLNAAGVRSAIGLGSANLDTQLDALPTAIENADALLNRDMSTGSDSGSDTVRTPRQALRFLRNKWAITTGTLSVKKEDDSTESWSATVTGTSGADPVTSVDPAGP
jgi:hypothetical protein